MRDLGLFPEAVHLDQMAKMLGTALTIEDLTGQKSAAVGSNLTTDGQISGAAADGPGGTGPGPVLTTQEMESAALLPRPKMQPPTDCHNQVGVWGLGLRAWGLGLRG